MAIKCRQRDAGDDAGLLTVQPQAQRNKRSASELARIGRCEQIAEAAHRLDQVGAEFLAQPADEDLDGVGIAIEILIVEMSTSSVRETTLPLWARDRRAAGIPGW